MTITDEMVEKALRTWRDAKSSTAMRDTLTAIAPLIRSAALEEAARVAERVADDNSLEGGEPWICEVVARDIRSLKDKQPDTRTPTEGESL